MRTTPRTSRRRLAVAGVLAASLAASVVPVVAGPAAAAGATSDLTVVAYDPHGSPVVDEFLCWHLEASDGTGGREDVCGSSSDGTWTFTDVAPGEVDVWTDDAVPGSVPPPVQQVVLPDTGRVTFAFPSAPLVVARSVDEHGSPLLGTCLVLGEYHDWGDESPDGPVWLPSQHVCDDQDGAVDGVVLYETGAEVAYEIRGGYAPDGYEAVPTAVVSPGPGGMAVVDVEHRLATTSDGPSAVDDEAVVDEDGRILIDVLANDTDPDGDPLSVTTLGEPSLGTVEVDADGRLLYVPAPNVNGSDTFTYRAGDGVGESAEATVRVTVLPVGDAPVSAPDRARTTAGTPVTVDVLANDVDPDGDGLTVEVLGASDASATVVDGRLRVVPARGFTGTATVTYRASDGRLAGAPTVLEVEVVAGDPVVHPTLLRFDALAERLQLRPALAAQLRNDLQRAVTASQRGDRMGVTRAILDYTGHVGLAVVRRQLPVGDAITLMVFGVDALVDLR